VIVPLCLLARHNQPRQSLQIGSWKVARNCLAGYGRSFARIRGKNNRYEVLYLPIALAFFLSLSAWGQNSHPLTPPAKPLSNGGDFSSVTNPSEKVPDGIILVKGAWSSASDSATPVPEGSSVTHNVLSNPYFGMSYALPLGWAKGYDGPPPSDTGRYVLAELRASDPHQAPARGSIHEGQSTGGLQV
jgi:hypothetical protein